MRSGEISCKLGGFYKRGVEVGGRVFGLRVVRVWSFRLVDGFRFLSL